MCTVVFIPLTGGGYLLGHNRDESVRRPRGIEPRLWVESGRPFLSPRDPEGNGSWIGVNETGLTACILNGAETEPSRLPPVPLSRGRILLDLLPLDSIGAIAARLERRSSLLREVRAFQVVAIERGTADASRGTGAARAGWFRWNGRDLTKGIETGAALFVSSGFDQRGAEQERGRQWRRLLASLAGDEEKATAPAVIRWLRSHEPEAGALSVCVHRSDARTVSRSLVTVRADRAEFAYHDGAPCDVSAHESAHVLQLN